MNWKLIVILFLLYCTSCSNNAKPTSLQGDSLPTSASIKQLKSLHQFRDELLKADPPINKIQLQFQLDTFSIERSLDSALGPLKQDDKIGSARNKAILSYLTICDQMADSVKSIMGKDSTVFVEEQSAWRSYYFKAKAIIGKVDDDAYLGLGADYSRVIGQDVLQEVKHRAVVVFTRLERLNGIQL